MKLHVFSENMQYIERHNSDPTHTFQLKMNQFGDLTHKEFSNQYLGGIPKRKRDHVQTLPAVELPVSWDWVAKGAVTPVENQDQCGSCYAFSVTGSVEGCHFINTGVLVQASAQNILDCTYNNGNDGCNGGLFDPSYQYIMSNNGIDSEACYPYTAQDNPTCMYNKSCCVSTVSGFVDVPSGDENALQQAVYINPAAIALDASQTSFQFYSNGVYYDPGCSNTSVDHSALAVGWGVDSGNEYWNVKNSWGVSWGMKGYIWMSRNRQDNCGIASEASYPTGCFACKS